MFTKSQLNNMNYDMRFASSPWIKIINVKYRLNRPEAIFYSNINVNNKYY